MTPDDQNQRRQKPPGQPQAAPAQQQAQQAQPPQQRGTGFVSFDRYFQQNQPQAQQMAQTVAGNVRSTASAAQQATQGAQAAFNAATNAAALQYDPQKAGSKEEAQRLAQTQYQGPKTWDEADIDTQGVTDQVTRAQDQVNSLATVGGRANLLRESYKTGPMSSGGSLLDAILTGRAGGDDFAALEERYGGLSQGLVDARQAGTTQVGMAQAQTANSARMYGEQAKEFELQAQREQERLRAEAQARANERAAEVRRRQEAWDRQDGQWTQEEADVLDDIKRGGRSRYEI